MNTPDEQRIHAALYGYTAAFDAEALISRFAVQGQEPEPGVLKNFLGTRLQARVFPPVLETMMGLVEPPPAPGNWHADVAEWAGALRSVVQARGTYRIIEVGCGWGCWINNMGVAARRQGLNLDLIGIEADAGHLQNARRTLELNGFTPDQFTLHHGVAGPEAGKAAFPVTADDQISWGGKAVFGLSEQAMAAYQKDPAWHILDCKTLGQLSDRQPVDLLHIDIQGSEVEYVTGNFADMQTYVRRVLIGTHSREIEGELMTFLRENGWQLEVERPALLGIVQGAPMIRIDGVQLWTNPMLARGPLGEILEGMD